MRKTREERVEAFREYLDGKVYDLLGELIENVEEIVSDSIKGGDLHMDHKDIKEFIDEVWVRCFLGERRRK